MSIRRVVPDVTTDRLEESRDFYVDLLGFDVAMDMGWVVTVVSPVNPTALVILMDRDASSPVQPQMSVEVADVDAVHAEAVRRGDDVIYPLTDEPWGCATVLRPGPEWLRDQRARPPLSARHQLSGE